MDGEEILHSLRITPFDTPDLMPQAGKDLIRRFNNNPSTNNNPTVIVFCGPPESGKTTLIQNFTEEINAAPMWVEMSNMIESYKAYPSDKAIEENILTDLIGLTFKERRDKNASRAALVIQNFDALRDALNISVGQIIFRLFFEVQHIDEKDPQRSKLLILCESTKSYMPAHTQIDVGYPDTIARKKLIAHFLDQHEIPYDADSIHPLVGRTDKHSITQIKMRMENIIQGYKKKISASPPAQNILSLISSPTHGHTNFSPLSGTSKDEESKKRYLQKLEREQNEIFETVNSQDLAKKIKRADEIQDEIDKLSM
jgi:hypothetical protein